MPYEVLQAQRNHDTSEWIRKWVLAPRSGSLHRGRDRLDALGGEGKVAHPDT